ncbi:MAG: septal ring lytic transglycosylase RlpA family protein [Thermodesulfobacteriota bacterium]
MSENSFLFLALLYFSVSFFGVSVYVGNAVKGEWTHKNQSKVGIASWYGKRFHGRKTASGKNFNMYNNTAAHRNLPLGTKVRVVNLKNGKDIIVDIIDRGPYIKGRIIDLSYAAAESIGMIKVGIEKVKVEVISLPGSRT